MDEQEILSYLTELGVNYRIVHHQAVFTMDDVQKVKLPHPEADAKNLFICDDKKRNYYLLTVKGDKRVDLKRFRQENNTRRLSFASPDDLRQILNLSLGSVTPLGLLNDQKCRVSFYLDSYFETQPLIAVHPNTNTATIWLDSTDLLRIIKHHGNQVHVINF